MIAGTRESDSLGTSKLELGSYEVNGLVRHRDPSNHGIGTQRHHFLVALKVTSETPVAAAVGHNEQVQAAPVGDLSCIPNDGAAGGPASDP